MMKRNALHTLKHGITTVRVLGDAFFNDVKLRDEIQAQKIIGPHLLVAGYGLCKPGGHGSIINQYIASVKETESKVNWLLDHHVNWIKLIGSGGVTDAKTPEEAGQQQLSFEIIQKACEIAHQAGIKVAIHSEGNETAFDAIRAGVDSIEHGSDFTDQMIKDMKNKKIGFIATLSAPRAYASHSIKETGLTPIAMANNQRIMQKIDIGFKKAIEQGVLVGAGTDAGVPLVRHEDFVKELYFMVHDHNVHPFQALQCATINNARILGIDAWAGSLETQKSADFIITKENPLENFNSLLKLPMQVYIRGIKVPN
jgi:imidazolonepropionase-like amidohydrolase